MSNYHIKFPKTTVAIESIGYAQNVIGWGHTDVRKLHRLFSIFNADRTLLNACTSHNAVLLLLSGSASIPHYYQQIGSDSDWNYYYHFEYSDVDDRESHVLIMRLKSSVLIPTLVDYSRVIRLTNTGIISFKKYGWNSSPAYVKSIIEDYFDNDLNIDELRDAISIQYTRSQRCYANISANHRLVEVINKHKFNRNDGWIYSFINSCANSWTGREQDCDLSYDTVNSTDATVYGYILKSKLTNAEWTKLAYTPVKVFSTKNKWIFH